MLWRARLWMKTNNFFVCRLASVDARFGFRISSYVTNYERRWTKPGIELRQTTAERF
jgi:hypothetical protein